MLGSAKEPDGLLGSGSIADGLDCSEGLVPVLGLAEPEIVMSTE